MEAARAHVGFGVHLSICVESMHLDVFCVSSTSVQDKLVRSLRIDFSVACDFIPNFYCYTKVGENKIRDKIATPKAILKLLGVSDFFCLGFSLARARNSHRDVRIMIVNLAYTYNDYSRTMEQFFIVWECFLGGGGVLTTGFILKSRGVLGYKKIHKIWCIGRLSVIDKSVWIANVHARAQKAWWETESLCSFVSPDISIDFPVPSLQGSVSQNALRALILYLVNLF